MTNFKIKLNLTKYYPISSLSSIINAPILKDIQNIILVELIEGNK